MTVSLLGNELPHESFVSCARVERKKNHMGFFLSSECVKGDNILSFRPPMRLLIAFPESMLN